MGRQPPGTDTDPVSGDPSNPDSFALAIPLLGTQARGKELLFRGLKLSFGRTISSRSKTLNNNPGAVLGKKKIR
jgi:hypothetical protein